MLGPHVAERLPQRLVIVGAQDRLGLGTAEQQHVLTGLLLNRIVTQLAGEDARDAAR